MKRGVLSAIDKAILPQVRIQKSILGIVKDAFFVGPKSLAFLLKQARALGLSLAGVRLSNDSACRLSKGYYCLIDLAFAKTEAS